MGVVILKKLIIMITKLIICIFPSSSLPPHFYHVEELGKKKALRALQPP